MNIILAAIILAAIIVILVIFGRRTADVRKILNYQDKRLPASSKNTGHNFRKFSNPNLDHMVKDKSTLEQADELFKSRRYSEAEKIYVQIAANEPRNAKIYNRLGVLYLEQENFNDAKLAFQEAIKFDDKIASRWYNLGLVQMSLQEFRNAEEAFEKAYKLEKKNVKYAKAYRDAKLKLNKFLEKK